jgi:hypothetical protein
MALSEHYGREFSMVHHRTQGWLLNSGSRGRVNTIIGRDITRAIHTHPRGNALMSDADIIAQLHHWDQGGKGALEIVVRAANGRAMTIQYGREAVIWQAFVRGLNP